MLRFAQGLGRARLLLALDSRLAFEVSPELATPSAPLLVCFPADNRVGLNFGQTWEAIPAHVRDGVREGRFRLILDNSGEGTVLTAAFLDVWYAALRADGISPGRVAYISQDINAARWHDAYCDERGISDRVRLFRYHWFIKMLALSAEARGMDEHAFAKKRDSFLSRSPQRKFLCFMNKARPPRIRLALSLLHAGLWDQGIVSFGGWEAFLERRKRTEQELGKMGAAVSSAARTGMSNRFLNDQLRAHLPELELKGRVMHAVPGANQGDRLGHVPSIVLDLEDGPYLGSRFSLVSETEMHSYPHRITEKSLKPFAHFHPAIFFSSPGTIPMLRELGFNAAFEWVNPEYDAITDPVTRFDAAFAEAQRLIGMSDAEWIDAYRRNFDVLEANARHFWFGLRAQLSRDLDAPLVRSLAAWVAEASHPQR